VASEGKNIVLTPFSIIKRSKVSSSEPDRRKIIHWKLAILIKGKAIPLQALAGSRRLRLPDFKTVDA
jgi:hypothetical protein